MPCVRHGAGDLAAAHRSNPTRAKLQLTGLGDLLPRSSLWAFVVALVAVFAIALLALWSLQARSAGQLRVRHTLDILRELAQLSSTITEAESGQRGYVITGREQYLVPYQRAETQLAGRVQHLRFLSADSPEQSTRVTALAELIEDKSAELHQ